MVLAVSHKGQRLFIAEISDIEHLACKVHCILGSSIGLLGIGDSGSWNLLLTKPPKLQVEFLLVLGQLGWILFRVEAERCHHRSVVRVCRSYANLASFVKFAG